MYIGALAGLSPDDLDSEPPIYWCNRTLRELGPDGESVHPSPCTDLGRQCYQSPLWAS